jgi:hypothetical protein
MEDQEILIDVNGAMAVDSNPDARPAERSAGDKVG